MCVIQGYGGKNFLKTYLDDLVSGGEGDGVVRQGPELGEDGLHEGAHLRHVFDVLDVDPDELLGLDAAAGHDVVEVGLVLAGHRVLGRPEHVLRHHVGPPLGRARREGGQGEDGGQAADHV